jgi:hypothetical protein
MLQLPDGWLSLLGAGSPFRSSLRKRGPKATDRGRGLPLEFTPAKAGAGMNGFLLPGGCLKVSHCPE